MGEDLSPELRDLLRGWTELWRYPEILSLLVRSPDAQAGEVARSLLGGIATPRHPLEAFDALLAAGEYEAAQNLLDRPGFRSFLSMESVAEQRAVLERRLLDDRQELRARVAALRERAKVAARQEDPPAGLEEALSRRRTQAEALLDNWEEEIRHGEAILELQYNQRLDRLISESKAPPEVLAVWRESVLRCIQAKRFRAAAFLLDGGPFEPLPDEPVAVPRSPEWFWQRSPRLAMDWINNVLPAPPDFRAWRHSPDDRDAEAVARLLSGIVDRVFPPEDGRSALAGVNAISLGNSKPANPPVFADREEVEEFAVAVDRLLGSDSKATPVVQEKEGGFETRLLALNDPRLPRFALQGTAGVRCWLPRTLSQDRPLDEPEEVVLCFGLSNSSPPQGNLIFFDLFSLLRLFSDRRHRRENFLREIGARLSPLEAIPADAWSIDCGQLGVPQARSYAAWLLDIVNVEIEGPELIEMLVFYSGARADLLILLTRALLEIGDERKTPATPNRLIEAWRTPGFRDAAAVALLRPLQSEPRTRAVLGAALVAGLEPGGPIEADEIPLLLEDFMEGGVAEDETPALIDRLVDLGLLVRGANEGESRIPPSGIGHLLIAAIPDVEAYLREALEDRGMSEEDRTL